MTNKFFSSVLLDIDSNNEILTGYPEELNNAHVVYIYFSTKNKNIYIGETKQFKQRHIQHSIEHDDYFIDSQFNKCIIFYSKKFSKTECQQVEHMLINYMSADTNLTKNIIKNRNQGFSIPKYQNSDYIKTELFPELWNFISEKPETKHLIANTDLKALHKDILYRYSPFTELSIEQEDIVKEILLNKDMSYKIHGGAGTGKSLLMVYLAYALANEDLKIGLITTNNLKTNIENIIKRLNLQNNITVGNPSKLIKVSKDGNFKYDTIIIDEAHRLKRYYTKGHPASRTHFPQYSKEYMGEDVNELDLLTSITKQLVLLYDQYQSIRPQDIPRIDFNLQTQNFETKQLTKQFRISIENYNSEDFTEGLLNLLELKDHSNFNKEVFHSNYFGIVNSIEELFDYVYSNNNLHPNSINRVIAGYCKEWKSKKDSTELDWGKWRWNSTHINWYTNPQTDAEIGSIHAIQGADLDYVGVIIGDDLTIDKETGRFKANREKYYDTGGIPIASDFNQNEFDTYIKNIYYILLTRGISGCRVYFTNKEVEKHFVSKL